MHIRQRVHVGWQITSVASGYQLQIDSWRDDRRDVVLATHTALRHLKYLHSILDNNWIYAISAYNAGQGRIRKSLQEHYAKHTTPPTLSQLSHIKESRNYVPKLLALRAIIADPKKYNVELPDIANQCLTLFILVKRLPSHRLHRYGIDGAFASF